MLYVKAGGQGIDPFQLCVAGAFLSTTVGFGGVFFFLCSGFFSGFPPAAGSCKELCFKMTRSCEILGQTPPELPGQPYIGNEGHLPSTNLPSNSM